MTYNYDCVIMIFTQRRLCANIFSQLSSQYSQCQWREPRDWKLCLVVSIQWRDLLLHTIGL